MTFVWEPAAAVNAASGVLMSLLGAALLFSNPRRDWNRLFGVLAALWGLQIVAANTVRLTVDPNVALLSGRLTLAFLIPLYFFIVAFAATFPRPRPPFGTSGVAVAALTLPAAAALAVLFLEPDLLIVDIIQTPEGRWTLRWGRLMPYLVTAPFFGALSYALFVMMRRFEEAPSSTERKQVGSVLAALGLYAAYYSPRQLSSFGREALGFEAAPEASNAEAALIAAIMAATVAILVAIAARLVRRIRAHPRGPVRRQATTILAIIGVGMLAALLAEALGGLGGPSLELVGVVRLGSIGLIVFAIARYQLFDLELRAKQGTTAASVLLIVGALGGAVYWGMRQLAVSALVQVSVSGVVAAVALVPMLHVAYRLADRVAPRVDEEGDHVYLRKLEVYRAAVERFLARGEEPDASDPELRELRERLSLGDRDHAVAATLAETTVGPGSRGIVMAPGEEAFGKYELETVIAEGGFGRVFRARDTVLGRPVAIKELLAKWRDEEALAQRFLQEARFVGRLNHPNIVSVYGVEEHGGDRYIIMEHVGGGSLADRLKAGALGLEEALDAARGMLAGLSAAHAEGIVHRDVKPSNVLFDEDGRVKLVDFGIANLTRQKPGRTVSGLASPGSNPGTLSYMSPEQARGDPVDERADVYSAAAVLVECLTGRAPVDVGGMDPARARELIGEGKAVRAEGVPAPVRSVLETALDPSPEDRFPSVDAFEQALEDASSQLDEDGS